ncbi:MAG: triose-phosphate isomerase [Candidatus Saccharicenans sp.]|jgi:triosephosphate isomerase|nr:triose-phosphate isomerase [Candidatus Saccharicenans sp.]MDH7492975.1 triose-phosphate isomerase [Candidatus Saccharicenans sp.]
MTTPKKPVIAGNWKMHKTIAEARELAGAVARGWPEVKAATLILIPPFTAIQEVKKTVSGTEIGVGAQDVFWEEQGAFTGEISPLQLREAGCEFVVIGHSERRQYFGETDESVRKKTLVALAHGLQPVVCIGESLAERESGQTLTRIKDQLEKSVFSLAETEFSRVLLAYEPVWAIGTGRNATPEQAEEVQAFIRSLIEAKYGKTVADYAIILYGGSVKPSNALSLAREKDVDGFLVGGASLEADSFLAIAREALRADEGLK